MPKLKITKKNDKSKDNDRYYNYIRKREEIIRLNNTQMINDLDNCEKHINTKIIKKYK